MQALDLLNDRYSRLTVIRQSNRDLYRSRSTVIARKRLETR